jgi:hypothetical protein
MVIIFIVVIFEDQHMLIHVLVVGLLVTVGHAHDDVVRVLFSDGDACQFAKALDFDRHYPETRVMMSVFNLTTEWRAQLDHSRILLLTRRSPDMHGDTKWDIAPTDKVRAMEWHGITDISRPGNMMPACPFIVCWPQYRCLLVGHQVHDDHKYSQMLNAVERRAALRPACKRHCLPKSFAKWSWLMEWLPESVVYFLTGVRDWQRELTREEIDDLSYQLTERYCSNSSNKEGL